MEALCVVEILLLQWSFELKYDFQYLLYMSMFAGPTFPGCGEAFDPAVFTSGPGTILSPAYIFGTYPPDSDCYYVIESPEGQTVGNRMTSMKLYYFVYIIKLHVTCTCCHCYDVCLQITLTFREFAIEGYYPKCEWDYLTVHDGETGGPLLIKACENYSSSVTSATDSVYIHFQ